MIYLAILNIILGLICLGISIKDEFNRRYASAFFGQTVALYNIAIGLLIIF